MQYLQFKFKELKKEFYDDKIVFWAFRLFMMQIAMLFWLKFGKPLMITSLYRPGDPRAHGHGCGADARSWEMTIEHFTWLKELDELFSPYVDIVIEVESWSGVKPPGGEHIHFEFNPPYWPKEGMIFN